MDLNDLQALKEKHMIEVVVQDTVSKKDLVEMLNNHNKEFLEFLNNYERTIFELRRLKGILLNRGDR